MRVILIRPGEIFLKGRNKHYFEKTLIKNIKNSLKELVFEFKASQNRYFIEGYDLSSEGRITEKLRWVFGIHSFSVADKIETDFNKINALSAKMCEGAASFRITAKRADKTIKSTSTKIASEIGAYVVSRLKGIKVDLENAEKEVFVDIRENGFTYIYADSVKGAGGLPVSTSGNGLLLLSGGIDSPVAGFKMAQRGIKIHAVHFASPPYTSEAAKEKVIELAGKLKKFNGTFQLYIIPFTDIQLEIHKKCRAEFMITLMRRLMMRISERIAADNNCTALVTGESLGQVASQTVESITAVNHALELLPVLRPLIGMDKDEIIAYAEKIDTYKTSVLPYADCCTVFLPQNPVIKPKLDDVLAEEAKLEVELLVENAVKNAETVRI